MGAEPFEDHLFVRRPSKLLLGLTLVPGLVGLIAVGAFFATGFRTGGLAPALLFASYFAALSVLRKNTAAVQSRALVRADASGLRVGGEAIPRSEVRDARLVPTGGIDFVVRVARRRRLPLELIVGSQKEGRRLLCALGFDASQTVMRFRGLSRIQVSPAWVAFALVLFPVFLGAVVGRFLPFWSPAMLELMGLGAIFSWGLLFAPTRIDVGADGVLLTWLGRGRFISAAKIRDVERFDSGFYKNHVIGAAIRLHDGEVIRLPFGRARWDEERVAGLIERIEEARETHRRGDVATAAALLGRGDRELRAWIDDLRAIGTGANATLRTASIQPDHLWRVVESPGEEPEERAAAAVALGGAADDAGKQRLRVAAGAIADTKLRVVIDAVTAEDDAALEEALREVTVSSRSSPSP